MFLKSCFSTHCSKHFSSWKTQQQQQKQSIYRIATPNAYRSQCNTSDNMPAKSSFSSRATELSIAATTPDQVVHQSNQICDSKEEPNQHCFFLNFKLNFSIKKLLIFTYRKWKIRFFFGEFVCLVFLFSEFFFGVIFKGFCFAIFRNKNN